jgi:energy-coupling factor transport system permease protein
MFFAFTLTLVALSHIGVKYVIKGLKPIMFIVLITFLINMLFTTNGKTLWAWRFITITDVGLTTAVSMALRLVLLLMQTNRRRKLQPLSVSR